MLESSNPVIIVGKVELVRSETTHSIEMIHEGVTYLFHVITCKHSSLGHPSTYVAKLWCGSPGYLKLKKSVKKKMRMFIQESFEKSNN